jgi:hypothetical protein
MLICLRGVTIRCTHRKRRIGYVNDVDGPDAPGASGDAYWKALAKANLLHYYSGMETFPVPSPAYP